MEMHCVKYMFFSENQNGQQHTQICVEKVLTTPLHTLFRGVELEGFRDGLYLAVVCCPPSQDEHE